MNGQTKAAAGPLGAVLGIVGAVGGMILGRYSGIHLLIPVAFAFIVGAIVGKTLPSRKPMLPAIAIQGGHLLWMMAAILMVAAATGTWVPAFLQIGLDIIVLGGGLAWLIARPGLGAVILLSIYQVLGLLVNTYAILGAPFDSAQHKALVVHILLRIFAIIMMIVGLVRMRVPKEPQVHGFPVTMPPGPQRDVEF